MTIKAFFPLFAMANHVICVPLIRLFIPLCTSVGPSSLTQLLAGSETKLGWTLQILVGTLSF